MYKPRLPLPPKINAILIILLATTLGFFCFSLIFSLWQTSQIIDLIKQQNFTQAKNIAQTAKIAPTVLSNLFLKQSATLESWSLSLSSIEELENLSHQINFVGKYILDPSQPTANLIVLEKDWENLHKKATKLEELMKKSLFLKKSKMLEPLSKINDVSADLLTASKYLSSGKKQAIILFQNTEEIRATGGFMGSYAKITFESGKITNLEIQDIYEPDGQFQGFVDAPPGAKEFLSGGNGLRLPDSNWNPDFASSAKTIATYFAFGHEKDIDLIVALNVDLMERVLKIVGDIYLPDYGLTASADNLTDLAHADRNSFFAGSKQKINFLSSLFTNLKIKITTLSNQQILSIAQVVQLALPRKELQFFAWDETVQDLFEKYQISGNLSRLKGTDFFISQIESNVGINKANKKISRTTTLEINHQSSTMTTYFHNDDSESKEDYINYHRIYLDPTSKIREIAYNGQSITNYEQNKVITANSEEFNEIGILLALPAGQSAELTLVIDHPTICLEQSCKIGIRKQPGLPPVPMTIIGQEQTKNLVLEQDEIVEINQL